MATQKRLFCTLKVPVLHCNIGSFATEKRKKHKLFCKRAGIEPTIGHLKADHRLSRNFYKGVKGDAINVLLVAAAYNFKRAMRVLLYLIKRISIELVSTSSMLKYSF